MVSESMTQILHNGKATAENEPGIKHYIPFQVPICLQYECWFLSSSITYKNAKCTTDISTNSLFLLVPSSNSYEIAIQSMSNGRFLDSEELSFKIPTQPFDFFYYSKSGQSFSIKVDSYKLFVNSDGHLCKDLNFCERNFWRFVFPGIPLLKLLSYDFCFHKTTTALNRLPFDVPVFLQSYNNAFLGLEPSSGRARCLLGFLCSKNQILLRKIKDDCIAIELRENGLYLTVHENGKCGFTGKEIGSAQKFNAKIDTNANIKFISCATEKIMECDPLQDANCKYPYSKNSYSSGNSRWKLVLAHSFDPPLKSSEKKLDYTVYCD